MRDTVTIGSIAGFAGTAAFSLADLIARSLGFRFFAGWEAAANLLLNWNLVNTPVGTVIGLVAQFILGAMFGVQVAYTLRLTGKDAYLLKGLGVAGLFWVVSAMLSRYVLDLTPSMRNGYATNLAALANYAIMGLVDSYIVARFAKFPVRRKVA